MRTLMALLILIAFSVPQASAVVDPDPNGVGVYFDMSAYIYETWVAPATPIRAYVILTNPSGQEILGFEFAYRISVPPGMENWFFTLSARFPPYEVGIPPIPDYDIFEDEVVIPPFSHDPIPGGPAVVLGFWEIMIVHPEVEVEFFLGPTSDGHLAYDTEDGPVTMNVSSGNPDLPVATVNREGVVPITGKTFGSVKALFR